MTHDAKLSLVSKWLTNVEETDLPVRLPKTWNLSGRKSPSGHLCNQFHVREFAVLSRVDRLFTLIFWQISFLVLSEFSEEWTRSLKKSRPRSCCFSGRRLDTFVLLLRPQVRCAVCSDDVLVRFRAAFGLETLELFRSIPFIDLHSGLRVRRWHRPQCWWFIFTLSFQDIIRSVPSKL